MSRSEADVARLSAAVYRQDFLAFVQRAFLELNPGLPRPTNWHVEAMAHALEGVAEGRCKRLLITLPPRHLKSTLVAVAFTAWTLGRDPAARILVASYGDALAQQHAADFGRLVAAGWCRRAFAGLSDPQRAAALDFVTRANGRRRAVTFGGGVTGLGADLLVVDDPMKAVDASSRHERDRVYDTFAASLVSRLNDKASGAIVVVMQRLHEDDLAGRLIAAGGWRHLNLPAIAQEDERHELLGGKVHVRRRGESLDGARESLATLEQIQAEMGEHAFAAQYLQAPAAPSGAVLRWDQIGRYGEAPPRAELRMVVQSWDVAMTSGPRSDYTVGTTWGFDGEAWLLLEVDRGRWEFPFVEGRVLDTRERWRADVVIVEAAGPGIPLFHGLKTAKIARRTDRRRAEWRLIAWTPRLDKATRFATHVGLLRNGRAKIPEAAAWLNEFKHELLGFPNATHDDQVDSMTQFLEWEHINARRHAHRLEGRDRPPGRPFH